MRLLQFILDHIMARLVDWKGKLMSVAGRRVLVRCVLSVIPTFALTALHDPKKLFKEIDKVWHLFLWPKKRSLLGGSCTPVDRGWLGVHDLERFSRALRLRWMWFTLKNHERAWSGSELPCDTVDQALFAFATLVTLGNGNTASFWHYCWMGSTTLANLFPKLYKGSRRKNRTIVSALLNDTRTDDMRRHANEDLVDEFIVLWRAICTANINLSPSVSDSISWKFYSSGEYIARSAYLMQFHGSATLNFKQLFWSARALREAKMFTWLLMQDRLWCNDRLQRGGRENGYFCPMSSARILCSPIL